MEIIKQRDMKKSIVLIMLLTMSLSIFAMPVRKGTTKTLHLADGTTVVATLCGDEYGHWWQSEDGQRFMLEEETAAKMTAERFEQMKEKSIAKRTATNEVRTQRMAKARKAWGNTTFTGQKKGLVILVNFSDKSMKASSSQEEFNDMFNKEGYSNNGHIGSVHDFFMDNSYGQFDLQFDVVGPVTVSKTMSYYGKNDYSGNDQHPAQMVIEACRLADEAYDLNFADYDWNGNGEVDQVYVVYAGYGEHAGGSSSTIWPHEYELSSAGWYGDGEGAITIDGVTVDTYAVSCELQGSSGSQMNGMGTACHEFSHCLGYPDFYDIDYSGGWGMDYWDVMDGGSYNGPSLNGEVPCGYSSYERWVAGWVEPKELKPVMTVDSLMPLVNEPDAYVMYNDGNKNEYYLLENRTSEKWFKYVGDYTGISGMLVIHVDYDASVWNNNAPNDSKSHQRMTIIPANNSFPSYGSKSDYQNQLYPYGSKNSLTNTTTPKASLFNKNTDGTKLMNKPIYDIAKSADGIISFRCGDEETVDPDPGTDPVDPDPGTDPVDPDPGSDPVDPEPEGDYIFYESFNKCEGTGGNDGVWNGSIATSAFIPDNTGWTANKYAGADKCAKFGTSSVSGTTTTPSFTLHGNATLTFKAACWDSSKDDTSLTILLNDEEVENLEMVRGAWTNYSVDVTGNGSTKVTFKVVKRFFLDEVLIVKEGELSGIMNINNYDNDVLYNLNGMRVGPGYKGIVIKNGKKYRM